MKKRNVLNLIRYYTEHNDAAFRNEAYLIAKDFDHAGDSQLAEYVIALLSDTNTFIPQSEMFGGANSDVKSGFLVKQQTVESSLPLPEAIAQDVQGVLNAIGRNVGIHRFLFHGPAGTGKTESVRQISKILGRELFIVDFSSIVDSKLGQTSKNIAKLFEEINSFTQPDQVVVLFDEIDALAMDRVDSRDVREMGRATSALLHQLDDMNSQIMLFATTNLFKQFDKAFIRRFDAVVDFGRYTHQDLVDIATAIMQDFSKQYSFVGKDMRLFKKVLSLAPNLPYPGELKNIIRSAVAFSKPGDDFDYMRRMYVAIVPDAEKNLRSFITLKDQGFTVREIEKLTGASKSKVSRRTNRDAGRAAVEQTGTGRAAAEPSEEL